MVKSGGGIERQHALRAVSVRHRCWGAVGLTERLAGGEGGGRKKKRALARRAAKEEEKKGAGGRRGTRGVYKT